MGLPACQRDEGCFDGSAKGWNLLHIGLHFQHLTLRFHVPAPSGASHTMTDPFTPGTGAVENLLLSGGNAGRRIAEHDWSGHPLGALATWPAALRTSLSIMLGSGFPSFIAWGREFHFFYNDAYAPLLGIKEAGAMGQRFADVWAEIWPVVGPIAAQVFDGVASFDEDTELILERSGIPEKTFFTFSYSPIRDEFGTIHGLLGTVVEMTAKVRAIELLNESRAELEEKVVRLTTTEDILRQSQKMEAVGQLTGGLAHDFNNLLGGIAVSVEMLQRRTGQGRTDELGPYIEAAQNAVTRAASLTHRLLAFSRRQTLAPKATDVDRLIGGMEELLRRSAGPAVEVAFVGATGLWRTFVDPHQLENAFLNLCINARDAMPDGGRLTIGTANLEVDEAMGRQLGLSPGQYIALSVTDTGTGMSAEITARAFEPFYTTKPMGEGTGLGLSMVYGFVLQSKGQVRIDSAVGQGTRMYLYLPRYYGAQSEQAAPSQIGLQPAGNGRTVMVVEDEPTIRTVVAAVVEDMGFTCMQAEDGVIAMELLETAGPLELLISDVGLPNGLNGRQLADAARVSRPDLKVLFITGYAANSALWKGRLDAGMSVLTKPFTLEALGTRMQTMLDAEFSGSPGAAATN